jgi:hypothetical protein
MSSEWPLRLETDIGSVLETMRLQDAGLFFPSLPELVAHSLPNLSNLEQVRPKRGLVRKLSLLTSFSQQLPITTTSHHSTSYENYQLAIRNISADHKIVIGTLKITRNTPGKPKT